MKISIPSVTFALLASTSFVGAHPGLSKEDKSAPCPFRDQQRHVRQRRLGEGWREAPMRALGKKGHGGVPDGGYGAVIQDLKALMTDSQDFWPADSGHYGGFFIRLAWHCAGSYRRSDGRGGCDGGRIRFDPELNWPDNGNLDKALKLLEPIKQKYGKKLSWGDLIILSGNAAIESMGGKTLGFCGGRVDDEDGSDSLKLGPSPEQEEIAPCVSVGMNGKCLQVEGTALGTGTVGLIYVNPGGPLGFENNITASAEDITRVFGTGMSFTQQETVALVGGGHAFGKAHGACRQSPCDGGGVVTSGWEGAWTTNPAQWDNEFFKNLFYYEWELHTGEGGKDQWKPVVGPDIMMLTSDLALAVEPYREHSERYANDQGKLEEDFAAAWYKLTTADMGPASRCIGDDVPPPQPFQNDLPPAPAELPDYVLVRARIEKVLDEDDANADALINLAYRCAATFRKTDWHGGCNGARIRFPPESEWPENKNSGTQKALALLELVKEEHGDVSYSDLIVLAGLTALESENEDLKLPFCGGRVDTENESNSKDLRPRHYTDPLVTILDDWSVKGLTQEEGVALTCRERVGSQYYKDLLADESSFDEYARALLKHEDLLKIVNKFAQDESKLLKTFEAAWTKMMTADRFKGYNENACTGVDTPTK